MVRLALLKVCKVEIYYFNSIFNYFERLINLSLKYYYVNCYENAEICLLVQNSQNRWSLLLISEGFSKHENLVNDIFHTKTFDEKKKRISRPPPF